ncbi:hypothetical protein [Saccharopolyspora gloriosae]|uniref:hypothetical protein n=1 Tax=Saccharopolyspora gloriosae TaxID=455344 RepID=UPI001FB66C20|nr:hypothetical protein [Saccharopolyspora gloriosae]
MDHIGVVDPSPTERCHGLAKRSPGRSCRTLVVVVPRSNVLWPFEPDRTIL